MKITKTVLCGMLLLTLAGCAGGDGSGGGHASGEENAVAHEYTQTDIESLKSTQPVAGKNVTLYINGMGCPLCVTNVDKQLYRMKSVEHVQIDLGAGTAGVTLSETLARPSPADFRRAVDYAGLTLVKYDVN